MTPYEAIQAARQRMKMKYGGQIGSRLLDAAEEGRMDGVYDHYLNPPGAIVENAHRVHDFDVQGAFAVGAGWMHALRWKPAYGSIFAYGPEGTGKSSMCRFLLAAWCSAGWPVMDLSATRIEHEIWTVPAKPLMKMAKRCHVLLIDDVTNARLTPRGVDALRQIIDARHEGCKATLITSQTDVSTWHDKIAEIMGDDVYATSLLRRLNPYVQIEFRGESYRQNMRART